MRLLPVRCGGASLRTGPFCRDSPRSSCLLRNPWYALTVQIGGRILKGHIVEVAFSLGAAPSPGVSIGRS
jgi:hypothetical protein